MTIDINELRRLAQAAISKMNALDPEFVSSVTPLAVLELLGRLEAAEQERDWHAERCQDAMTECDALRAAVRHEADCGEAAKAEIDALRAKIEAMEKQAQVAWTTKLALEHGASTLGFQVSGVNMWGEKGVSLYALPVAQSAPSVPDHKTIRDLLNESGLCAYDREGDLAFMVAATKFAALAAASKPEAKP